MWGLFSLPNGAFDSVVISPKGQTDIWKQGSYKRNVYYYIKVLEQYYLLNNKTNY